VFGGSDNTVHLVTKTGVESWPRMSKDAVAEQLAARIRDHLLAVA
jgi:phosphopantothenoylcysteine decarboxylase/phosphopantothenate--cysteine ligase